MPDWQPSKVLEEGHGLLSSLDERRGGVAGAVLGGAAGVRAAGPAGAVAGALGGWIVGEEIVDVEDEQ